jgi:hypothetical protein
LGRLNHALMEEPDTAGLRELGTESLLAVRQAYQVPETGKRFKSGEKLGDAQGFRHPRVQTRMIPTDEFMGVWIPEFLGV